MGFFFKKLRYSEQLLGQVPPLVDAAVHGDEAVHSRFVPHVWIMETRVQHNNGKRQHVARVWTGQMHRLGFTQHMHATQT